jgi:SOS-response transcriptional repressor LexA
LARIYEKGGATYQQMANEVGTPSAQAIQACLRKMGEKGLIEFRPRYRSHEKKRRVQHLLSKCGPNFKTHRRTVVGNI